MNLTLQELTQQLARIERQTLVSWNSSATLPEHCLVEIPNNMGILPSAAIPVVWFPTTRGHLYSASNARLGNVIGTIIIVSVIIMSKRNLIIL